MARASAMNLLDVVCRATPEPWAEGDNIPWDEPEFSRAMLKEHLSQAHDAASRRAVVIDCAQRLGHTCVSSTRRCWGACPPASWIWEGEPSAPAVDFIAIVATKR